MQHHDPTQASFILHHACTYLLETPMEILLIDIWHYQNNLYTPLKHFNQKWLAPDFTHWFPPTSAYSFNRPTHNEWVYYIYLNLHRHTNELIRGMSAADMTMNWKRRMWDYYNLYKHNSMLFKTIKKNILFFDNTA